MKKFSWLNKNISSPTRQSLFVFILLIILPNLFFLYLSLYTSTARPLFNIDYFVALLLILLPWKVTRLSGSIVLVIAMLFDVLMFVIQVFPFMDLAAIHYLISFIPIAPTNYIIMMISCSCCILIILWLILFLSRKTDIRNIFYIFTLISLLIISYVCMTLGFTYASFRGIFGRDNYYVMHSQSLLYKEITKGDFMQLVNLKPDLSPLENDRKRAADRLLQPHSEKILFIISESWGELRNIEAQNIVMEKIYEQKENFEFLSSGSFFAVGATVAGELRELCGLELINNGFAFSQSDISQFSSCLPKKFEEKNYRTVALHGTSGLLYDRADWYPKAGFQQTLFGENFMQLRRCAAFKGICDSELMNVVAKNFASSSYQKLFFYWMTLTSHQPYAKQDIHNHRFDCSRFNMNSTGDACHNAQLQIQFLDDLAKLVQRPEMQGVEVIIVGDHAPPVWGDENRHIRPLMVSYLHFKVKAVLNGES